MKRALAVFLMLLLVCVPNISLVNFSTGKTIETVVVHLVPENITVRLGQPFFINVVFENLPVSAYNGVTGCEFNLTWDNSIFEGISMKEIAFHTATPQTEWWNIWNLKHIVSNGSILYAYCWQNLDRAINQGYAPLKGNGTWASLTFVGRATGETDLHFVMLKLGSMTQMIGGIGVDAKIAVSDILAGDINQDKSVDSTDASMLSAAFGCVPQGSCWNSNADINCDNIVDICDAIILANNYGRKIL